MPSSPAAPARPLEPIAVVGVGALFPGSSDKAGFWRDILAGRDLVTEVPPTHWLVEDYFDADPAAPDKIYAKRGAFLQAQDFNPLEFAIPPTNLPSTDTAQLLALLVAKQVLEDAAGNQFKAMDRSRMSVVLGVASATELVTELSARMQRPVWADALRQHGFDPAQVEAICDRISGQYVPWTENSFPGMLGNVVAGRIANRFDLAGTNCVIDAACASSLAALHLAVLELGSGHSDLVITGGVDALNDPLMYACFSKTPALSPTGDCRPFAEGADGTILGEGLGMLALKRLADAERDGDAIYAVIRGLGTSSDGLSKSIYAPVADGQAKALRRAYASAGYAPGTVELLEAHGTGTRAGDLAEFQGLARVFGEEAGTPAGHCALGSVKSQIGHTKAAAGSAGLFKAVMALHHKVLPPTIKVDAPNPALGLEASPFYLNTRARPWVRDGAHPRRASVSSFGFGGSNYHVALEEYTGPAGRRPRLRTQGQSLLLVAADSAAQLVEACRALDLSPAAFAHTVHQGLQAWEASQGGAHRLALVVSAEDAPAAMAQALERITQQPGQAISLPGNLVHYGVGPALGPLALLFSGQGSQYLEMGRDLAMAFDSARAVWDRAAGLDLGPVPLHQVVFPKPVFDAETRAQQERTLTATQWAQPAIGAVQLSQLALLRQVGITPAAVAGHSFGELTALAAAGSLSEGDLLRLARERGACMATASDKPGAMTAVMNSPAHLAQEVAAAGLGVVLANSNTPAQLVFSGEVAGVERLEAWLTARQLEYRRLPVSTAFHSPLVEAAVAPLHRFLEGLDIRPPTLPVSSNTTAQPYPTAPDAIRQQLAAQLAAPVRFREQIEALYASGVRIFLEVGPRGTLASFAEQTLAGQPHLALSLDRAGSDGVLTFCQALARLAAAGVSMSPSALWREYEAPAAPRQGKPAMAVPILGVNYGRPYPPQPGTARAPAPVATAAAPAAPVPPQTAAPHREAQVAAEAEYHQWMEQLRHEPHPARMAASNTPPAHLTAHLTDTATPTATAPTMQHPAHQPQSLPAAMGVAAPAPLHLVTAAAASPQADAIRQTLLEVVAEKTGYPTDMLDLSLELESGLGIDSIKRVEILSAFRDRMPGLPEVAPTQLAALNTLGDVLAFMQGPGGNTPAHAATAAMPQPVAAPGMPAPVAAYAAPMPAAPMPAAPPPAAVPAGPDANLMRQTLLEVVAEKTGYPTDMLDLSLELESGLGIDSIKRVEILSAFRDRMPGLPEVAPTQLAALNTLGDVLAFMQGPGGDAPAHAATATIPQPVAAPAMPAPVAAYAAPMPAAPPPAAVPAGPDANLMRQTLLEVVAEKTGYPTDMLDLSLELESGLGIDSIKRVEILSAFRDRMPGLQEVAPTQLAALNTLGDVLAFMQGAGGSAPPAAAASPALAADLAVGAAVAAAPAPVAVATPTLPAAAPPLLPRHAVRAVRQRAAGFALPGLLQRGALIGVTDDGQGVAPLVVQALAAQGVAARVLVDPSTAQACTGLLVLDGLRHVASPRDAIAANRRAFESVHAMAARLSERDGVLVTVQNTGGDFGLSGQAADRAWLGGIAALARTAANEWPQASVKAIDLEAGGRAPYALAKALVAELLEGGAEREVGLPAQGERLTLATELCAAPAGRSVVDASSVVVATGGARGVTALCLQSLAQLGPRIAILGRTPLADEPAALRSARSDAEIKQALLAQESAQGRRPTPMELSRMAQALQAAREVRANLQAMEAAGAQVLYCVADVADPASVEHALAQVRQRFGPITCLVHGAGVLADKLIKDKTLAQYDSVFATKVGGVLNLLTALRQDPLQAIVMFSSVAARVGNPGQSDYAMANEVLNQVALMEAPRRPGCLVRAIGWGPWDGGMVTPALRAHFDAQGVALIDPDAGAAAFMAEMHEGGTEVELVVGPGEPRELLARDTGHGGSVSAEVVLEPRRYAFLESHCVGNQPVVPVVLAAEWFMQAARALVPGADVPTLRELRVLKGIVLADWGRTPTRLRVSARYEPGNGRRLRCELHSGDGSVLHYAAIADFSAQPAPIEAVAPDADRAQVLAGAGLYGTPALFHGPALQAIRQMAVSRHDVTADLYGAWALGLERPLGLLDLPTLDGGLQVALAAVYHATSTSVLPTQVDQLSVQRVVYTSEAQRCAVTLRSVDALGAVGDIVIRGGGWAVRMTGVHFHARVSVPVAAASTTHA